MKYVYDSTGAAQIKRALPLFGNATNIVAGAALIRGATDGTNLGYGIVAPVNTSIASGLFIGVAESLFAAATLDNDPTAGTKYILTDVTINPHAVWAAQYDNRFSTNALTIASIATGTPSITVTSGESIGGGWVFFDNYELHWVKSSSTGTYTLKTVTSSAITTSTKVAKILPLNSIKICLSTNSDNIGTNVAAAGAIQAVVLENYIKAVGYDNVPLDPTKHDNIILPSPNSVAPAIFANIQFTQHVLETL